MLLFAFDILRKNGNVLALQLLFHLKVYQIQVDLHVPLLLKLEIQGFHSMVLLLGCSISSAIHLGLNQELILFVVFLNFTFNI